jgi:hypothetical protein
MSYTKKQTILTAIFVSIMTILAVILMNTAVSAETTAPTYAIPEGRYDKYLFVGDSRFVGMSTYCKDDNVEYFAKSSQGLKWFNQNYDTITSYRGYNIVINLGVNDLYNLNKYIDTYNSFPEEFTENNNIILVSVNPCSGSHAYLNKDIEKFNDEVENNTSLYFEFINTYDYLNYKGFNTSDGVHYTKSTYQDIYNAIMYGF